MAFTFNATIQLRFGGQLFRVWVGTGWLVTSAVSAQINDLSGPKVVLKEGLKEGNVVVYANINTYYLWQVRDGKIDAIHILKLRHNWEDLHRNSS